MHKFSVSVSHRSKQSWCLALVLVGDNSRRTSTASLSLTWNDPLCWDQLSINWNLPHVNRFWLVVSIMKRTRRHRKGLKWDERERGGREQRPLIWRWISTVGSESTSGRNCCVLWEKMNLLPALRAERCSGFEPWVKGLFGGNAVWVSVIYSHNCFLTDNKAAAQKMI